MKTNRSLYPSFQVLVFSCTSLIGLPAIQGDDAAATGDGPGLKRGPAVKLDAPRSLELTHAHPAVLAAALGRDPERIFAFVRDEVTYEAYAGCLRGPRGTQLALAGNSVDRAALVASLLSSAGQKVRFARGPLPERDAAQLVDSMWAPRPAPELDKTPPESLQEAGKSFQTDFIRDCGIVSRQVRDSEIKLGAKATAERKKLVALACNHYWVQVETDGKWTDYDPSFADSAPGRARAVAAETFGALPRDLFHKVALRVRVEEYPVLKSGDAKVQPAWRTVLSYKANAADLSAVDLVLVHQPENWKGPAKDIRSALGSSVGNTGRLKPVLLTPDGKWQAGDPFRTKLPEGGGLGGFGAALSGEGVRKPAPLVIAEQVEIEFTPPGGQPEIITRGLFDLAGQGLRFSETNLTSPEVRDRTAKAGKTTDLQNATYDLLFTTGEIHATQLSGISAAPQELKTKKQVDLRKLLRRINTTFAAVSDRTRSVQLTDGSQAVLYLDTPRVTIAEVSFPGRKPVVSIDLRRDQLFAAARGQRAAEAAFTARMLRGINDGTLERVLIETITAGLREKLKLGPVISTSSVFGQAQSEGVGFAQFQAGKKLPFEITSDEVSTRVRRDGEAGYLVVAPIREIKLGMRERFAWWRIDPATGETTAVTDEGLYQTGTEDTVVTYTDSEGNVVVTVASESPGGTLMGNAGYSQAFVDMEDAQSYISWLNSQGFASMEGTGVVPQEFSIPVAAFP